MKILFVGHRYHQVTRSSEFFLDILRALGAVEEIHDNSLDGAEPPLDLAAIVSERKPDMVIVWQIEYLALQLARLGHPNAVFMPMYDGAAELPIDFWHKIRSLRVLAFSLPVLRMAAIAGCRVQYVQYWPESDASQEYGFESDSAFFWYRKPDVSPSTLGAIARTLKLARIDFLHRPDPSDPAPIGIGNFRDAVPCPIREVDWAADPADRFRNLLGAGVFIASRKREGIGMAFLEAMARGRCVVAPQESTYTDYIVPGLNGLTYRGRGVEDLEGHRDLARLGHAAREGAMRGRGHWEAAVPRLRSWLADPRDPGFEFQSLARPAPAKAKAPAGPNPAVTVVTVVRNAEDAIAATIESVLSQTGIDFQYLVLDGASTDRTLEIARSYGAGIDKLVSEPDEGVYDAMNKAAHLASGDFLVFLNAGDIFLDPTTLAAWLKEATAEAVDFVFAHHVYGTTEGHFHYHRANVFSFTRERLRRGALDDFWHSGIPGHQATATRAALLRAMPYDTRLSIAADHDLMFRAHAAGSASRTVDLFASRYEGGGYSSRHEFSCVMQWIDIALRHTDEPEAVWRYFMPKLFGPLYRYGRANGVLAALRLAWSHPGVPRRLFATPFTAQGRAKLKQGLRRVRYRLRRSR